MRTGSPWSGTGLLLLLAFAGRDDQDGAGLSCLALPRGGGLHVVLRDHKHVYLMPQSLQQPQSDEILRGNPHE